MAALFGILPILQAISVLCSIWGLMHVSSTTDTIITYGASGDLAPTVMEYLNSFGALILGGGGWAATWWAKNKSTAKGELFISALALVQKPRDYATIRRFAFAVIDWFEATYAKPEDKEFWDSMVANLRAKVAETKTSVEE